MRRDDLGDILAFLAVAEVASFTRAAGLTGTSQAALSYSVQRLEGRLGVRLLNRTTRRVSLTEAGERLAATSRPNLAQIDGEMARLRGERDRPAGLVRITTNAAVAETRLWPAISQLLHEYPDLKVELSVESRLVDIVAERFDAGVRLGDSMDADMIAVRIGPDIRMAIVGAPDYLARRGVPEKPQDLMNHNCINLRLPTMGGLYAWELGRDGRALNIRVDGSVILNSVSLSLAAARDGHGLVLVFEDQVRADIEAGRLVQVMAEWCQPFPGFHIYYPSRRHTSPALAAIVNRLRWRG